MRRALLLGALLLLTASEARAGNWRQWPTHQLVEAMLEWQCELLGDDRSEYSGFVRALADERVNDADIQAGAAAFLADAANRRHGIFCDEARTALTNAERLGRARPLARYARATLTLGDARRAGSGEKRDALLRDADAQLAAIASDTRGSIRFYACVARTAIALDRADMEGFVRRRSEAIIAARQGSVAFELEQRFRVVCTRRLVDLGEARLVLREARALERTRWSSLRRLSPGWTEVDELVRSSYRRWTLWALVRLGRAEEARAWARSTEGGFQARAEAEALLDLGDGQGALAAARRARNLDPGHESQELVARALLAVRKPELARGVLDAALADGSSCVRCAGVLARIELMAGHEEAGARLLDRAERSDGGSPEILAARSILAARRGELAQANALGAAAFGPAAREDERATERDTREWRTAMFQGQYDRAQAAAAAALALRPRSEVALRMLAEACARGGDPRAPWLLERLGSTQDWWVLLARGTERARRGQLEDARRDLARGLAIRCATDTTADLQAIREAKLLLAGVVQRLRRG